jgi:hypothetical protein
MTKMIPRKSLILKVSEGVSKRLMISVPMTGLLRAEWVMARYGQVIPCNWSSVEVVQWMDQFVPMGYLVADARNVAVQQFIDGGFEWLFFIDHDVVMPPGVFTKWNEYMIKGDVPIFGGLYFTKSVPSEPLMYRGRGNSYFSKWQMGKKVWVDGMGLGCNMIHRSILKTIWEESEEYQVGSVSLGSMKVRKVFETPSRSYYDPEDQCWKTTGGTEDLTFYSRLIDKGLLKKAGWPELQRKQFPYLCDTSVFCRHIDWGGTQYPSAGEEKEFTKDHK